MKTMKNVTVSMPEEMWQRIRLHANYSGRTMSGLVRISVERFLEGEDGQQASPVE